MASGRWLIQLELGRLGQGEGPGTILITPHCLLGRRGGEIINSLYWMGCNFFNPLLLLQLHGEPRVGGS